MCKTDLETPLVRAIMHSICMKGAQQPIKGIRFFLKNKGKSTMRTIMRIALVDHGITTKHTSETTPTLEKFYCDHFKGGCDQFAHQAIKVFCSAISNACQGKKDGLVELFSLIPSVPPIQLLYPTGILEMEFHRCIAFTNGELEIIWDPLRGNTNILLDYASLVESLGRENSNQTIRYSFFPSAELGKEGKIINPRKTEKFRNSSPTSHTATSFLAWLLLAVCLALYVRTIAPTATSLDIAPSHR